MASMLRRIPRDALFALTVGFCSVPILAVCYVNSAVRDTLRPYALHARESAGVLLEDSYVLAHSVFSMDRAPPPLHGADASKVRVLSDRIVEDPLAVPVVVPESPLYSEAARARLVAPGGAGEGAVAGTGQLRVRGMVNLNNLEAAKRALHDGEEAPRA